MQVNAGESEHRPATESNDGCQKYKMKCHHFGHTYALRRVAPLAAAGIAIFFSMSSLATADALNNISETSGTSGATGMKGTENAPASAAVLNDPNYQLGSGDHIRVIVYGQPDLSGEFQVDGSGKVAFPLVGNIKAGGQSVSQFETRIVNALKPDYLQDPRVSIEVLNYRPFYIVGEVQKPGNYPYTSGMTVINAVAMAGGFTYRARDDDFTITHANTPSSEGEDANQNTKVEPGDVITVPERWF